MIPDGFAVLADYLSFHVRLSKRFREQVSASVPFCRWGRLDTDFLRVTEQTHSKAGAEFQSPEYWETRG